MQRSTRLATGLVTTAILLLPVLAGGCSDPASAAQFDVNAVADASLAGTWQFNRELSDCPDPAAMGDRDRDRDRLHDGSGQQHRQGPPRPGMGGPGGPRDGLRVCQTDEVVQLTISVTETAVVVSHDGERSRTIPTDGSAVTHEGPGGSVSIAGAWVDGALVVTQTTPRGTATTTHTVAGDGNRLTVVRSMEPADEDREPRAVTHVWDRVTD